MDCGELFEAKAGEHFCSVRCEDKTMLSMGNPPRWLLKLSKTPSVSQAFYALSDRGWRLILHGGLRLVLPDAQRVLHVLKYEHVTPVYPLHWITIVNGDQRYVVEQCDCRSCKLTSNVGPDTLAAIARLKEEDEADYG
jgi:hypothetical protein